MPKKNKKDEINKVIDKLIDHLLLGINARYIIKTHISTKGLRLELISIKQIPTPVTIEGKIEFSLFLRVTRSNIMGIEEITNSVFQSDGKSMREIFTELALLAESSPYVKPSFVMHITKGPQSIIQFLRGTSEYRRG
jgi:hypothetical protein